MFFYRVQPKYLKCISLDNNTSLKYYFAKPVNLYSDSISQSPFSKYIKTKLFRTPQTDSLSEPIEESQNQTAEDNEEDMDQIELNTESAKTTNENTVKSDKSLIDSMIDKFDSLQTGIEIQNKQMKRFIKK